MPQLLHLLFVCTYNEMRSRTAEHIFRNRPNFQVRSAGTALTARRKVTGTDISWADIIFVMEKKHQEILAERFPTQLAGKRVIRLDIPDQYPYMDEELVQILEEKVKEYLPP